MIALIALYGGVLQPAFCEPSDCRRLLLLDAIAA
jgi:hypothetical protein